MSALGARLRYTTYGNPFSSYERLTPNEKICPNVADPRDPVHQGGHAPFLVVTKNGLAPDPAMALGDCPSLYSVEPQHNESDDYFIQFDCIDPDDGHFAQPSLWRVLRDGSLKSRLAGHVEISAVGAEELTMTIPYTLPKKYEYPNGGAEGNAARWRNSFLHERMDAAEVAINFLGEWYSSPEMDLLTLVWAPKLKCFVEATLSDPRLHPAEHYRVILRDELVAEIKQYIKDNGFKSRTADLAYRLLRGLCASFADDWTPPQGRTG